MCLRFKNEHFYSEHEIICYRLVSLSTWKKVDIIFHLYFIQCYRIDEVSYHLKTNLDWILTKSNWVSCMLLFTMQDIIQLQMFPSKYLIYTEPKL